mmetsp:Transcript_13842/g.21598  ORF Transcript_13842/g.21598 Transcript_13842/m.21598 type:complete len:168 (-) Transcript_13842:1056-1559(-)
MDRDRVAVSATIAATLTIVLCVIYVAQLPAHEVVDLKHKAVDVCVQTDDEDCKGSSCPRQSKESTQGKAEKNGREEGGKTSKGSSCDGSKACALTRETEDPWSGDTDEHYEHAGSVDCEGIKHRKQCKETKECVYTTSKGCVSKQPDCSSGKCKDKSQTNKKQARDL